MIFFLVLILQFLFINEQHILFIVALNVAVRLRDKLVVVIAYVLASINGRSVTSCPFSFYLLIYLFI